MVFESLVVGLLNKYLGTYIENLDASQLQIGIWGGKYEVIYFTRLFTYVVLFYSFQHSLL